MQQLLCQGQKIFHNNIPDTQTHLWSQCTEPGGTIRAIMINEKIECFKQLLFQIFQGDCDAAGAQCWLHYVNVLEENVMWTWDLGNRVVNSKNTFLLSTTWVSNIPYLFHLSFSCQLLCPQVRIEIFFSFCHILSGHMRHCSLVTSNIWFAH